MRPFIIIFLTLFLFSALHAYEDVEFGEISQEELQMVSFEDDPEADVVFLYDRAEVEFDENFDMYMKRETRVKILTEKGKEWASIRIAYWHKDKIWDIEAYSYLPSGEEFELDDDNISDEQSGRTRYKKFDIPGIEVGSVIEYKYTLFSTHIYNLEPWYFQRNAYTKFSQVSFYLPPGFVYSTFYTNLSEYDIKNSSEQVFKHAVSMPKYTWTGTNIPAIREEPYMKAETDYYAKIQFQLVSYKNPYVYRVYAKTWDDIAKNEYEYYSDKLDESGDHRDFMETYLKDEKSKLEKAKKIYQYIRDNIYTEYVEDADIEDIFNKRKGSTIQKNLLLMNLLYNEGITVNPLLISTRNHGEIYKNWPNMDQFNRVISVAKINKKTYFLDVNSKFCPFGYLEPNLDVGIGFKIMEEKGAIIKMKPLGFKNLADYKTEISINDDGSVDAESKIEYRGYLAIRERAAVDKSSDLEEHVNKKLEDYEVEAEIDTFYYANLDSLDKPVKLTIKYKLPGAAEISDNLIYMTVPFITGRKSNPFVREKRLFPVDYSFTSKAKEELTINFPENFSLTDKPKEIIKRLKKFNYSKIFFISENSIRCRRTFEIARKHFQVREYKQLKEAFDKIIESDQAILVLEKKATEL